MAREAQRQGTGSVAVRGRAREQGDKFEPAADDAPERLGAMLPRSRLGAAWDTPGLLLDPSLGHYPIGDFRRVKARKPRRTVPHWHHDADRKSFAHLVQENHWPRASTNLTTTMAYPRKTTTNGYLPLLRIEVRLKKKMMKAPDPGPVHLVWNSTMIDILTTDIVNIEEACLAERRRFETVEEARRQEEVWSQKHGLMFDLAVREAGREMKPEEVPEGGDEFKATAKE